MKPCHNCGGDVRERTGQFKFDPPPNIPGGTMVIRDCAWEECDACGERLIPPMLRRSLDMLAECRKNPVSDDLYLSSLEILAVSAAERASSAADDDAAATLSAAYCSLRRRIAELREAGITTQNG